LCRSINKDSDSDGESSTDSEGTSAEKEATYQENSALAIQHILRLAGMNTNTDSLLNGEDAERTDGDVDDY
jgi:hypothetical protein